MREPYRREPGDALVGRTLRGKYLVEQRIGSGGMGVIYRGLHLALGSPVALKVIRRGLRPDPAAIERFHDEARRTSRLRHPHIVSVTDFGEAEDGTLFMAMEHIPGKTLARVIAEGGPLSERRVVRIGAQILAAVAEAHAHRILHRDLNPSNVMIEPGRRTREVAKVLDFGIAIAGERALVGACPSPAGAVWGTHGYMSPEQSSGGMLDGRSDLYSVGVILYEMLTGEVPAGGQGGDALHGTTRVSARLSRLVSRALSPSPEARPGTAEVMREELLAALEEKGQRARLKALDAAVVRKAERDLAVHLGPLAAFVVARMASRARDAAHLYELLELEWSAISRE